MDGPFPTTALPPQRDRNADFGYLGLHVGDDPSEGDRLLAERFPTFKVTRAMCGETWQFRAGDLYDEQRAFCGVHRESACELIYGSYRSADEDRPRTLFSITYVRNFDAEIRPTDEVLQELQHAFGTPVWRRSIVKTAGWPDVPQATNLVFVNDSSVDAGRFATELFPQPVVQALVPMQVAIVRLMHPDDVTVTRAFEVEILGWPKAPSALSQHDERPRE